MEAFATSLHRTIRRKIDGEDLAPELKRRYQMNTTKKVGIMALIIGAAIVGRPAVARSCDTIDLSNYANTLENGCTLYTIVATCMDTRQIIGASSWQECY